MSVKLCKFEGLIEMLKGINRRIIEINRTDNDYFEKAILFVRSDKLDFEQQLLSREANSYLRNLVIPKNQKKMTRSKALIISAGAFLVCLCVFGIFSIIF